MIVLFNTSPSSDNTHHYLHTSLPLHHIPIAYSLPLPFIPTTYIILTPSLLQPSSPSKSYIYSNPLTHLLTNYKTTPNFIYLKLFR